MKKKKKDLTLLWQILYVIFFFTAGFIIYNASAKRNVELLKQMEAGKTITEIRQEQHARPNQTQNIEKYNFKYSYLLDVKGYIKKLIITIPVPSNEVNMQTISNFTTSYQPDKIYSDGVNNIAEFTFTELNNEKLNVTLSGNADLQTYDFNAAKTINKNMTPEKDLSKYLKPEQYIESNDLLIKSTAKRLKGKTPEETITNIYEYTQKTLNYTHIPGISGAKRALQTKKGECSEYSAVMIALCRANGIPARVVTGNIAREKNNKHNWVEVYFDKYGWVTFDPTVMPNIVNVYNNGKLVRQEKRFTPFAGAAKYIISARNEFSPYYLSYTTSDNKFGSVSVEEHIEINKIR